MDKELLQGSPKVSWLGQPSWMGQLAGPASLPQETLGNPLGNPVESLMEFLRIPVKNLGVPQGTPLESFGNPKEPIRHP